MTIEQTAQSSNQSTLNETIKPLKAALKAGGPTFGSYLFSLQGVPRYFSGRDRAALLTLGFIRGIPYRVMEPKSHDLFKYYGHSYTEFVKAIAGLSTIHGKPATAETINAWMAEPEPETHRVKRETAEAKAKELRAARRVEYVARIQAERAAQVA